MSNMWIPVQITRVLTILCCIVHAICALRAQYPDGRYHGNSYDTLQSQLQSKINEALGKLDHSLQWVKDWPDDIQLGQVSGLALDNSGRLLVFHRASNVWELNTFSDRNVYTAIGDPPIEHPTILVFNNTGNLVDMWGQNLFYMPHGITVDVDGNIWVTDVALHQVFKFKPDDRQKPALVLGEKFIPGDDDQHFCKPSAVAVMSTGDFFVADGYCNHRILKFSPDGQLLLQWGKGHGSDPFTLVVPHALALAEDRGAVCVANRERGHVTCFRADNGTLLHTYSHELVGARLFSVAYSPAHGGRLYVVNGPYSNPPVPVRGYVIDYESGRLSGTFAPAGGLSNPHDVAVTPDGAAVYVAEIDPYKVHKFIDTSKVVAAASNASVPVKPTATVEGSGRVAGGAGGALGAADGALGAVGAEGPAWSRAWRAGAAGAAGAGALVGLAALALLRARNTGRKSMTRRRWEYGHGEFKLRRLLERRRFTRVHSDDSDDEPAPMLPPPQPATA